MHSRIRLIGVALVCAKLALVPVVFDQASDVPFSLPKALLSHSLAYILSGVMVGLVVQYGRSFFVRSWLHVPVLTFLVASVVATVFAADSLLALYGTQDRRVGLGTIADGVSLYFSIVLLVRSRQEAVAAVLCFLAGSAVVLGYEFVQVAGRDPFAWSVDGSVRPFSTIGQTTNLAEYLTVVALGVAALSLFHGALRAPKRALLLVYSGLLLAGILLTQTRSALLGVLGASVVLVALTWAAHPNPGARFISLVGVAGAAVVLAGILLLTPLGSRVLSTVEISATAEGDTGPHLEQSADVRVALYRMALEMVRDRPVVGYGPDNILAVVPRYRSEHEPFEVQESPNTSAHGWVAQVAATSGLVGLVAYVAIAAVAVWVTVRNGFRPATWAALAMLIAFLGAGLTTVNAISTDWLFWGSLGAVAASTQPRGSPGASAPLTTPRGRKLIPATGTATTRRVVGFAAGGVGLIVALTAVNALDASHSARSSQVSRLQGRTAQAIELGLTATRSDPRRAQYWDTLGLAYVSADRFTDAVAAFERASNVAPYDVRYHGDLARAYVVLTQRGDKAAGVRAREVGERAVQIDPNNPRANLTRAIVMQVTGDLPEAFKSVERALVLDQANNRDIYLTGTQVLVGLGRPTDAVMMARLGITRIPNPLNQVPIRVELVRALIANGQLAEALTEIDAALAIQPNQSTLLQLRAQVQTGLGR
jgi:O-antigen ligase/Tfp pilus assembly protein PilF